MTDNTQEIDEILNTLLNVPMWFTDPDGRADLQEAVKNIPMSAETQQAKQAILDWHNKQIDGIKICGKTVDEIVPILSGLEIERATEITVTMANLRKLYDKLKEEQQEVLYYAINSTLDRAKLERNKLKEES